MTTTVLTAANEAQLNKDIATVNAAASGAYQIDFTKNITETGTLSHIKLKSAVSLTIDGGGGTLDGAGAHRGFVVDSGHVAIENLTIADAAADGLSAQQSGGGGAGLGGGLFVAAGASVAISNVLFSRDDAAGGAGGDGDGAGGTSGAVGHGVGTGQFGGGAGGAGGYKFVSTTYTYTRSGGTFRGGYETPTGAGGGGGGFGAGGDIFVQQGGALTIEGGILGVGTVTGGSGGGTSGGGEAGSAGQAAGSAMFIAGNQQVILAPGVGQTLTIAGVVADQTGSGGVSQNAGLGSLLVDGPGTVALSAANTFAGGIALRAGVLDLANAAAAGTGTITFAAPATLAIEAGDAPTNIITGLAAGDVIDLKGIGLAAGSTLSASATLTIVGSVSTVTLNLDPSQNFNTFDFSIVDDGHGGTLLTTQTLLAVTRLSSATSTGKAFVTGGQSVTFTLTTTEAVTVGAGTTLTLSNGAAAIYQGNGSAASSSIFTYTVTGGDVQTGDLAVTGYSGSITDNSGQALSEGQVTEVSGLAVYPSATSFAVSNEAQLNAALAEIDAGGVLSQPKTAYSIALSNSFTLSSALKSIQLASGDSLTIDGGGGQIDGGGAFQGFVVNAGDVTFQNLTIADMRVVGAKGGDSEGGGVATGGGLFIAAGANVALSSVVFSGDDVTGGAGGPGYTANYPGPGQHGRGIGTGLFGGGAGGPAESRAYGGGGGGLAAGGDIFVQQGGALTIETAALGAGRVHGGAGGQGGDKTSAADGHAGASLGSAIFIAGNQQVSLAPALGQTLTIAGTIADQTGSGGARKNAGLGSLLLDGLGTVDLSATNHFAGGIVLKTGVLDLANASAAGKGEITFAGASATLAIEAGDAPANVIGGLAIGDVIDLKGIGLAAGSTLLASATLTVVGSGSTVTLDLDPAQNFDVLDFSVADDGHGGTLLTTQTLLGVSSLTSATSTGKAFATGGQSVTFTLTTDEAVTVAAGTALTLSNGSTAIYQGDGSASSSSVFTYTLTGSDTQTDDLTVTGYSGSITDQSGQALDETQVTEDSGLAIYPSATSFTVSDEAQLSAALTAIDTGGQLSRVNTAYSIALSNSFTLSSAPESIQLASGDRLTIDGGGATIDGDFQALTVNSGSVDLENLSIDSAQGMFIQGKQQVVLTPSAGQSVNFTGVISDPTSSGGHLLGSLLLNGQGSVTLSAANTFAGGITLQSGVLELSDASAAGTGDITFADSSAQLTIDEGDMPSNAIAGLAGGGQILLEGVTADAAGVNSSDQLVLTQDGVTVATLRLAFVNSGIYFLTTPVDGGTQIVALPIPATVAQYSALAAYYKQVPGGFAVVDTAANILAGLAGLESAASHITAITATDAGLDLFLSQAPALEAAKLKIAVPAGDALTVHGSAANIEALTPAQISALVGVGASNLVSTNASVSFTPAQSAAIAASGLTVSASGNFTVTENTANGFSVYRGGVQIEQKFIKPDGSYEIGHSDVTGQTYIAYENVYNAAQAHVAETFSNADGSGKLGLFAPGAKFAIAPTGDTLTTGSDSFRLGFHAVQTISAGYLASETFALAKGFGQVSVSGFTLKGAGHDTIDLSVSMFSYLTSAMTQAQDLAAVLSHATASGGGLTIADTAATPDALTLSSVTSAELTANPADVAFAGASSAKASAAVMALVAPHEGAVASSASLTTRQRFIEAISTLRHSHGGIAEPLHAGQSDRLAPALFASIAAPH